ncbi:MAG: hypothetical protein ACKN80_06225, partial [Actinomycetales bacterium]
MESAYFQVSDVASEISAFLEALTADPARLENLQVRKSALRSFAKRFGEGASLDEQLESAIERAQGAHERLQDISGGAERIRELEEEVARRENETLNLAKELSSLRAKESERLA